MVGPCYLDIGHNFGVRRIFQSNMFGGHEHQDVVGVKNGGGLYVTWNGVIGKANAVDLNGQFHGNIAVAEVSRDAHDGPATHAVAHENDLWRML